MKYTLMDAAIATSKSKSTIQRSIKKGTISANKNDNGVYEIDPSELHRIFPETVKRASIQQNETERNASLDTKKTTDIATLHHISQLEQSLAVMTERKKSLEEQKDHLTENIEYLRKRLDSAEMRFITLLNAPRPKSFWRKIFER